MVASEDKIQDLKKRMKRLGIEERDLIEKFILASGKGGQKVNKTYSCVYLKHIPTGIEVKCQRNRSRELNRFFARGELSEKIEASLLHKKTEKQKQAEKIRRQKLRRSRKSKNKILEEKKKQSEKKALRQLPKGEE